MQVISKEKCSNLRVLCGLGLRKILQFAFAFGEKPILCSFCLWARQWWNAGRIAKAALGREVEKLDSGLWSEGQQLKIRDSPQGPSSNFLTQNRPTPPSWFLHYAHPVWSCPVGAKLQFSTRKIYFKAGGTGLKTTNIIYMSLKEFSVAESGPQSPSASASSFLHLFVSHWCCISLITHASIIRLSNETVASPPVLIRSPAGSRHMMIPCDTQAINRNFIAIKLIAVSRIQMNSE